ncbi:MAG: thioredoxin-dependent thiol peroxidase [Nanoarchaeota archaeon]|nr:thioredoxin-dependent thiol peroxidase [Nanoarchaeota archaeon]
MINRRAPYFTLEGIEGVVNLTDFKGKKVILYFYPKDMTPGCTIQANDFTAFAPEFEKENAVVVGISKDPITSHEKFKVKEELDIILLTDEEHFVQEEYGVWQKKKFMGRSYMGTSRTTFVIDERGYVRKIWENVKVKGHAKEVLKSLSGINS